MDQKTASVSFTLEPLKQIMEACDVVNGVVEIFPIQSLSVAMATEQVGGTGWYLSIRKRTVTRDLGVGE